MRIGIVDYGNYSFIRSLSTSLVRAGVQSTYFYNSSFRCPQFSSTHCNGQGATVPVAIKGDINKYAPLQRWFQDREWIAKCLLCLEESALDLVVCANAPILVQNRLKQWCRLHQVGFVLWMQDIHGRALRRILPRRLPLLGTVAASHLDRIEHRLLRESDHTILISPDHVAYLEGLNIESSKFSVIQNWADLDEHPQRPKVNAWSIKNELAYTRNIVYSGTLGMKHDPELLAQLAKGLEFESDIRVVVISEGIGADWLRAYKSRNDAHNLVVLPFQPNSELPNALGSADVVCSILSKEAAEYSVPSKILTYMCSGRPILMSIPSDNLAARLISQTESGLVVPPSEPEAFVAAAHRLLCNPELRKAMGQKGRAYAEQEFDSERIVQRFLPILKKVATRGRQRPGRATWRGAWDQTGGE